MKRGVRVLCVQNQPLYRENGHFSNPNFTQKPKIVKTGSLWDASFDIRATFWDNKEVMCGDFQILFFWSFLASRILKIVKNCKILTFDALKMTKKSKFSKSPHITFVLLQTLALLSILAFEVLPIFTFLDFCAIFVAKNKPFFLWKGRFYAKTTLVPSVMKPQPLRIRP